MSRETRTLNRDVSRLAEDARALLAITADAAGEKAKQARKRLSAAQEHIKDLYGRGRDKAVEGATAADHAVREHPYQAVAIGFGVGALLGYLVTSRCCRNGD